MGVAIQRAPKGAYQKVIRGLERTVINPLMAFGPDESRADLAHDVMFATGGSDLWKDLTPAYGRCDMMEPGKYRKARVFAFETPTRYIWCNTETGDRGTTWLMAKKDAPQSDCGWSAYERDPAALAEAAEFLVELSVQMGMNNEGSMARLRERAPILAARAQERAQALREASEIEAVTRGAGKRGPRSV